jgi:hypothetical protein
VIDDPHNSENDSPEREVLRVELVRLLFAADAAGLLFDEVLAEAEAEFLSNVDSGWRPSS